MNDIFGTTGWHKYELWWGIEFQLFAASRHDWLRKIGVLFHKALPERIFEPCLTGAIVYWNVMHSVSTYHYWISSIGSKLFDEIEYNWNRMLAGLVLIKRRSLHDVFQFFSFQFHSKVFFLNSCLNDMYFASHWNTNFLLVFQIVWSTQVLTILLLWWRHTSSTTSFILNFTITWCDSFFAQLALNLWTMWGLSWINLQYS